METVEQKAYKFDELSDEAKEKALNNLRHINVGWNWCHSVLNKANELGIVITSIDLEFGSIDGFLKEEIPTVADNIIKNYSKDSQLYNIAICYKNKYREIIKQYDGSTDIVLEWKNTETIEKEIDDLEKEFSREVLKAYLAEIRDEYDYQVSNEAVKDTIRKKGYLFTESGELYKQR